MRHDFMKIRGAGFLIAMGESGTGYSNLGRLGEISSSDQEVDELLVANVHGVNFVVSLVPETASIAKTINCELIGAEAEIEVPRQKIKALGIAHVQALFFPIFGAGGGDAYWQKQASPLADAA